MEYIALGKSNLMVSRIGFGAMSLGDFKSEEDAAIIVHKAYDAGINFFDTSHTTLESEKRLGACLHGIRQNVILATKSSALTQTQLQSDLEKSLFALQADYVDLFQYEYNSKSVLTYEEIFYVLKKLKDEGKIRHFGFVTETDDVAKDAITTNLFETIQVPFNILTSENIEEVRKLSLETDTGFIAMQPLFSGLVRNIPLAVGFLRQYENVVPLWGFRDIEELEQILFFAEHPPVIDEKFNQDIKEMRAFFS